MLFICLGMIGSVFVEQKLFKFGQANEEFDDGDFSVVVVVGVFVEKVNFLEKNEKLNLKMMKKPS